MVIGRKLKTYGVVLGVFLLGASAGAASGYAVASKRLAEVFDDDRPGSGDERRFEALSRALDLDRAQRDQVRVIMTRHREENRALTRAMFEKCGEGLRDWRERVDGEIRGVLTPSQQQRFQELVDKRGRRFPLGAPGARRHR